jgi:hypothetical protein
MNAAGKRYVIHGSRSDRFTIWNISDIHLWAAACSIKRVRRDIKAIQEDPYSLWLSTGDNGEYIPYNDKRFDPSAVRDDVAVKDLGKVGATLGRELVNLFRPIADKCLGVGMGNHEFTYMLKSDGQHLHGWLCEELGVPDLAYSSLFDVVFCRMARVRKPRIQSEQPGAGERRQFRFFTHHGAGYAVTKGGKLNRLLRFMDDFEADVYMIGHLHDQTGTRRVTVGANSECTELADRQSIGVISGAYLKTYQQGVTTYGEIKGYAPATLGASWVAIRPETRELWGRI